MITPPELLDLAKQQQACSDYRLAEILNTNRFRVSAWRRKAKPIPDEIVIELARLARRDGPQTLAEIHASQAKPEVREIWEQIARRAAPITLAAIAAIAIPPHSPPEGTAHKPFVYIMLTWRRLFKRVSVRWFPTRAPLLAHGLV